MTTAPTTASTISSVESVRPRAFKSIRGAFPINGVYTFTPAVTFHLEGESTGFFKLADPLLNRMLQRQWDTNLANIKDIMETAG
jgi:hypothetical protein